MGGDSFTFSHPVSGKEYTLTVQELEQQILPKNSFGSDRYFYPAHYVAMSYTLTSEPLEEITIQDCGDGDKPLKIEPADVPFSPTARNDAACIGIIGGARGSSSNNLKKHRSRLYKILKLPIRKMGKCFIVLQ